MLLGKSGIVRLVAPGMVYENPQSMFRLLSRRDWNMPEMCVCDFCTSGEKLLVYADRGAKHVGWLLLCRVCFSKETSEY